MPTTPELDAALLAAAQALPAHFADADSLTTQTLDAIQATTMSLPGGAFAVESTLNGAGPLGSLVLVITGLVDHKSGEVFDRTEARNLWTEALNDGMTAMQADMGEFKSGQAHMTDPFDVLESADEASVAGVFKDQTLAALIIGVPSETTGEGAAAQLAAAIAEAEAAEAGEDADAEGADDASEDDGAAAAGGDEGETTEAGGQPAGAAAPGEEPAPQFAPGAGVPGYDPYQQGYPQGMPPGAYPQGYPAGAYPPPGYGYGYGYGQPPQDPEQVAAAQAAAAARAQANAGLPGMTTPPLTPFMPGPGFAVDPRRLDLLREVVMGVSVELGRTRLTVQEILGLTPGSVVELDRAAGAPVDVLVNGTLIAHGEVVVVDEEFAVRISEVVSPEPGAVGRAPA